MLSTQPFFISPIALLPACSFLCLPALPLFPPLPSPSLPIPTREDKGKGTKHGQTGLSTAAPTGLPLQFIDLCPAPSPGPRFVIRRVPAGKSKICSNIVTCKMNLHADASCKSSQSSDEGYRHVRDFENVT